MLKAARRKLVTLLLLDLIDVYLDLAVPFPCLYLLWYCYATTKDSCAMTTAAKPVAGQKDSGAASSCLICLTIPSQEV